jgi:hypothetical protein
MGVSVLDPYNVPGLLVADVFARELDNPLASKRTNCGVMAPPPPDPGTTTDVNIPGPFNWLTPGTVISELIYLSFEWYSG